MSTTVDCAWLLADPGTAKAQADMRLVIEGGLIQGVVPAPGPAPGPRQLALPALTNAHGHGRYFRSATVGAFEQPLESWLPFMGLIPGADPYLNAATAFARSVRHGVANLMVHYTRVQGGMPYVDEARSVARAARDVGNRIGFAIAMRDRHGIGYCDDATALAAVRPGIRDAVAARLSVKPVAASQQLALVDEVARMVDEEGYADHVTVQYGPAGVQWCSTPLLEAIAQASADHSRPVHMHLLETRYQREWADHAHPEGIVRFLDDLGMLTPRLTLAHCVWARPDELSLLAERGVTIAVNTSSNLYLKSGIAPVPEMLRQGCRIALGLDCTGVDEDNDPLREMRLAYQLHRGWGFDVTMDRADLWTFAARNGRRSVNGATGDAPLGGRLAAGAPADVVLLNWDKLDDDSLLPVDPLDLLLARGSGMHVDGVIIGGRTVVAGGRVCGVDEHALRAELITQMRERIAARPEVGAWHGTLQALAEDLGPFYRNSAWRGCC
ncbi:S-adenosylhomocysteine deaminase; Methylthioadenosine deaminase [Caballeronia glathei]|uniref:Hydrolase n=1 Tax=Caballeronia glathei TaxID=60547 RepID=A0A069PNI7_9BURK|nr:amidohydrolase family protein [Caballeronia glathei]KDR41464.1 hydrolase [Caballeronia glathei]CDY77298.1 S-adenosylhomocysteine deaminase; Methylthioadenosine deaminase [Caballeronia glathei]